MDANELIEYVRTILIGYFQNHDWYTGFCAFHPEHFSFISVGVAKPINSHHSLKKELQRFTDKYKNTYINDLKVELVTNCKAYVVITARFNMHIDDSMWGKYYESARCVSMTFIPYKNTYKIINYHIAKPSNDFKKNEYIPQEISSDNYLNLERKLTEKKEQIEMILRTTAGGMKGSFDDDDYTFFYVNDELCRMLGYSHKEFVKMSRGSVAGMIYPPDAGRALTDIKKALSKNETYTTQYRVKKKDNTLLWVMDSGRKIINSNRQIVINSIITDISPLKNALERLKIEQNINDILFDLSDEIIFQYDAIKNTAILKLKNKNNSNIHKKFSLLSTKKLERYGIVDESIQKIEHYIIKLKNKLFLHRPIFDFTLHQIYNNKHIWWRVKGIGILNSEHKTVRMIGKLTDITNNVCLEEKSSHDSLTGLYNRDYLINYIKENINIKNDVKNCYYTLVLFDIDHFKTINDLLGHPTGDKALCLIADVLSAKCSCDMIAARIGGDEFAIFVPHIDARDKLKCILVEIIDNIREEGWNNHISLNLSISIGVSSLYSYSKDVSFKKLYKEADIALYKAKNSGRSRYVFYEYDETKTTL